MNDTDHDEHFADTVESLHEAASPGQSPLAAGGALAHRVGDEESAVLPGGEGDFVGAETTELLKLAAREAIDGISPPAAPDTGMHATLGNPHASPASGPMLDELGAVIGETAAPQAARQLPRAELPAPASDELGGILRDFELRLNGCVDALVGEHGNALEHRYRLAVRRAREEAAAALREREAALRAQLDADYRHKEQTLRSNYRKLVETANRMKQQKAQLQQARQQFEEKLDAVNALHRKVEDMRRQLRDHLGPEAS